MRLRWSTTHWSHQENGCAVLPPELMGRHGKPAPVFPRERSGQAQTFILISLQENAMDAIKEGHAAAGQKFFQHAAAVNEPQQDALACRERMTMDILAALMGRCPRHRTIPEEQKRRRNAKEPGASLASSVQMGGSTGAGESGVFLGHSFCMQNAAPASASWEHHGYACAVTQKSCVPLHPLGNSLSAREKNHQHGNSRKP